MTQTQGGRPHVTLKLATSLDGRIAAANGESRWITGPEARRAVHEMRAAHDAVIVGIGTALADDPDLTARLEPAPARQPVRIVIDSRCRLGLQSKLVRSAGASPVVVYTSATAEPDKRAALTASGVQVRIVAAQGDKVDLAAALRDMLESGLGSVFVEGGGQLAASLIDSGLVDRLEWMRAPMVLGARGTPSVGALAGDGLAGAARWRRADVRVIGEDIWESYVAG